MVNPCIMRTLIQSIPTRVKKYHGVTRSASSATAEMPVPPHLHFGIYDRGAINPLPFIDFAKTNTEPLTADPEAFSKWGRIVSAKANVRPLPSTQEPPLASLSKNNPVQIIGGTGEWYQVQLPEGERGFIYQTLVELADTRLGQTTLRKNDFYFSSYSATKPLLRSDSELTIEYFGSYRDRQLSKIGNRWVWLNK